MCDCNICGERVIYLKEYVDKNPNLKLNSPMLTTSLWKLILGVYKISYDKQQRLLICDNCMKKALGRDFIGSDFRDCEISNSYIKYNNLNLTIPVDNDSGYI